MNRRLRFTHEQLQWDAGAEVVGIDEVGRGALAGPIYASVVCFPSTLSCADRQRLEDLCIYDSKKITPRRRRELTSYIQDSAWVGIGASNVAVIDEKGIVQATYKAMGKAMDVVAARIPSTTRIAGFIDAFIIPGLTRLPPTSQQAIIRGDSQVLSIAAASIMAKVARDEYMVNLAHEVPGYGFETHKGYGTATHRAAIIEKGPCKHHRKLFIRNIFKAQ